MDGECALTSEVMKLYEHGFLHTVLLLLHHGSRHGATDHSPVSFIQRDVSPPVQEVFKLGPTVV